MSILNSASGTSSNSPCSKPGEQGDQPWSTHLPAAHAVWGRRAAPARAPVGRYPRCGALGWAHPPLQQLRHFDVGQGQEAALWTLATSHKEAAPLVPQLGKLRRPPQEGPVGDNGAAAAARLRTATAIANPGWPERRAPLSGVPCPTSASHRPHHTHTHTHTQRTCSSMAVSVP
jgi:hypothetical protein